MNAPRGGGGEGATSLAHDEAGAAQPREGSTLHYALLWSDAAPRARFLDRLALLHTLATTLDDVHDPGVAERKVHWWHEELERLSLGRSRHPRTLACQESLAGLTEASAHCLEVLSVAATTRYTPALDDAERRARLVRDHGARLALLAHALSGDSNELTDPAVRHPELAFGLGLREALARLPALLHRGYTVFSEEDYERHGLTPATLARHVRRHPAASPTDAGTDGAAPPSALEAIPVVTESPARRAIVETNVATARHALDAAIADERYRACYARAALAPLARLVALRAHELRLWQERAPDLLRERTTPTPLAKLYVAWRHRRGARRSRVH